MGSHVPGEGHCGNPWCLGEAVEWSHLSPLMFKFLVWRIELTLSLLYMPSTGIRMGETSPAEAVFMLCI